MEIDRGVAMNVLYFFCGGFTRSSFWSFLMTAILPGLSDVAFRLTCSCSPVDNTKQLHDLVFFLVNFLTLSGVAHRFGELMMPRKIFLKLKGIDIPR